MKFLGLFVICIFAGGGAIASEPGGIQLSYNVQRPGYDYSNFRVRSADECARKCEASRRCQAFDFHRSDNSCWLKDRISPSRPYQGVVSGIKRSTKREVLPVKSEEVSSDMILTRDTQRPGGDYSSFRSPSARQCAHACSMQSRCLAFDYTTSDSLCYLKSRKPLARGYNGIISGVKKLNSNRLLYAQEFLVKQYYNPGPVDGLMGRRTRLALKEYQRDHGLPVTGRLDEATFQSMEEYDTSTPETKAIDHGQPEVPIRQEPQTNSTQDEPYDLDKILED